jgi:hypothetical protein
MKLRVSIPQIVCNRTTIETSPDEIYFAYFVAQGKRDDSSTRSQLVARRISEVWRNVRRNDRWTPVEASEIEVDDDAAVLGIVFGLYEKDDGKIRAELEHATAPIDSPEPWKTLDLPASTDWTAWAKAVFKFVLAIIRQIPRDDEIGRREISINPNDAFALSTRTFDLKGFGGKYTVTLLVERVP